MATATFKILGITNDVDTCDCCGRTGLKRTVILGVKDTDGNIEDVRHYGSNCAARATRIRRTGKAIEALAELAQREAEEAETRRVVIVNDNPLDVTWVIESIGSNGGSVDRVCFAKGTELAVYAWARREYPYKQISVRKAI